ncbi:DUF1746-domain-containing protein [Pseudovirgaria hyperparasitica]|uniref:DUF1746-domain-containing protein n=1 Tax=Pseudovirgaria hyperparasitica TaxID=470096 RepID=A0A6A6VZC0_9PEZI|nr:DUF1746-domain-containing protein [Pseudovirgaria hyperparasitica]KAF2755040.1 DUF1746-domain-containing protein [Pseudovirgaria hyperparasitica]
MNDEAGPSGTQRPHLEDDTSEPHRLSEQNEGADGREASANQIEMRKRFDQFRRQACLKTLLDDFDAAIMAQMAILYCLDCSLFRFLCRAAVQFAILTPRPANAPKLATPTPYVGLIFGTNILILIFHMVLPHPEAGEMTRGYLHGGALIDFIGTEGPVSKTYLVLLDLSILVLQCIMLSAHIKRKRVIQTLGISQRGDPDIGQDENASADVARPSEDLELANEQDHDAEERGVYRADSPDREADVEARNATAESAIPPHLDVDALPSGQVIVADLYVLTTIREQFIVFRNARRAASSTPSNGATGPSMTTNFINAGRRVGLQATLQRQARAGG